MQRIFLLVIQHNMVSPETLYIQTTKWGSAEACFEGDPGLTNRADGLALGTGISSIMYIPLDFLRLFLSAALPVRLQLTI